jgi:hypothetical protein
MRSEADVGQALLMEFISHAGRGQGRTPAAAILDIVDVPEKPA